MRTLESLPVAARVLILTGAGISAESGVPTFRGGGSSLVWRGMPFEVLSSAEMVRKNLPLVWEWFDYRLGLVGECEPNAGHVAIAEAQKSGLFQDVSVVTQNIDGLHTEAGAKDVIELHGCINQARCRSCEAMTNCGELPANIRPPVCLECGGEMRPNVVLFGEMLYPGVFESAVRRAEQADVCLVVGTSAVVYPAIELPHIAKRAGAKLIEVNPEPTPLTPICDTSIRGTAGTVLPGLLRTVG
jgi:NAD-dependent deacetylase